MFEATATSFPTRFKITKLVKHAGRQLPVDVVVDQVPCMGVRFADPGLYSQPCRRYMCWKNSSGKRLTHGINSGAM